MFIELFRFIRLGGLVFIVPNFGKDSTSLYMSEMVVRRELSFSSEYVHLVGGLAVMIKGLVVDDTTGALELVVK